MFPNRLRQFEATGPDQIWVSDMTYLRKPGGFVYLAVVLDAWSRRVVGWALGSRITAQLVSQALQQAVDERQPPPALVHHSDRGTQYASQEYVRLLSRHGMIGSMSRLANPYDNARCESFFKTLKTEQGAGQLINEASQWQQRLAHYLAYYNGERLHSALGYQSPIDFERQSAWVAVTSSLQEFAQA